MILVHANEATAAQRTVYFDLRDATDGITAETAEAGGQPQISTNGGAWTNTGIGTLTAIGNGRYYAALTQAAVATAGDIIETRYKSAATVESPGDSVQVIGFDPTAANWALASVATEARLAELDAANLPADVDAILADTGTDGVVVNSHTTAAKAELQTEANDALVAQNLDHLLAAACDANLLTNAVVDNSVIAFLAAIGADISDYSATTDSLEAIRNNLMTPSALIARMTGSVLKSSDRLIEMVEDDTAPTITVIVTDDDGNAVDITGATIKVRFYEAGSKVLQLTKSTADVVTITDGPAGTFTWTWAAADWNSLVRTGSKVYELEVEITYADTTIQSVYQFYEMTVRAKRNTA